MNKKYIAIIISLVLIFSSVLLISGCNKDGENTIVPNGSTTIVPETEKKDDESSTEKTEKETEKNTEAEKESENTSKVDESETEGSTKPVEKPTDKDEPVTCDNCGGIIADLSATGDTLIGNYCDGHCDEWFSF